MILTEKNVKSRKTKFEKMILKFAPAAATRLISLTQSENEEVARKASLDVINLAEALKKEKEEKARGFETYPCDEKSSEMLAILANNCRGGARGGNDDERY
jgi:hypothetical protein